MCERPAVRTSSSAADSTRSLQSVLDQSDAAGVAVSQQVLLGAAIQICEAIGSLGGAVHGNLTARNCLVLHFEPDDPEQLKVRVIGGVGGVGPIDIDSSMLRWMAPEVCMLARLHWTH